MPNVETLEDEVLSTVEGGVRQMPGRKAPSEEPTDERRTWGQVGREYGAACASGAATSMMYGGLPRNVKDGVVSAATGCALGMGTKLIDDITGVVTG